MGGDEQVWAPGWGPRSCSFLLGLPELRVMTLCLLKWRHLLVVLKPARQAVRAVPWFPDRKGLFAFLASAWVSWELRWRWFPSLAF